MQINNQKKLEINFNVYLHIQKVKGKTYIEIRRLTNNPDAIKDIIDAAFFNKPLIVYPIFQNKLRAVSALMQNGIIDYNYEKKEIKYLI